MMNRWQKAVIFALAGILCVMLVMLTVLVIEGENKRQSDARGMATIDAIETNIHSFGD